MNQKNTKILVIISLVLLVLAGTYFWYVSLYRPLLDQVEKKTAEHRQLLASLETAKRQAAKRVSLQQEYDDLQKQWQVVETLLPRERNMSDFIKQLHRIKGKVDATIERVSPLKAKSVDFYMENAYEIEMLTTYHGLGGFLSHVANLPIIVDVTSLDMTGLPRQQEEEEEERDIVGPSVRSRLVLTTYSLRENVDLEEKSVQ